MHRSRTFPALCTALAVLLSACRGASTVTPSPTAPPLPATSSVPTAAVATTTDDWTALEQRPLHLPTLATGAACPVSSWQRAGRLDAADFQPTWSYFAFGPGPVYPIIYQFDPTSLTVHPSRDAVSGWTFDKVLWLIAPTDRAPALVRARRLDSPAPLPFFHGRAGSPDETVLQLPAEGSSAGWQTAGSGVRFPAPAPGCYAFQVDGQSFSDVIVFAVAG